jgi:hypothetical protein
MDAGERLRRLAVLLMGVSRRRTALIFGQAAFGRVV